jgi:hypothetical protein
MHHSIGQLSPPIGGDRSYSTRLKQHARHQGYAAVSHNGMQMGMQVARR